MVLDIGGGEGASLEGIFVVVDGGLGAFDHRALEVGVAVDIDLEAFVASLDAGLFLYACVVALDLLLAIAGAGSKARANRHAAADVLVFGFSKAVLIFG